MLYVCIYGNCYDIIHVYIPTCMYSTHVYAHVVRVYGNHFPDHLNGKYVMM